MSTFVIAYLAASAVFVVVLVAGSRLWGGAFRNPPDINACNQRLSEIDKKLREGSCSEEEASAARLAIISGLADNTGRRVATNLPHRRMTLAVASVLSLATSLAIAHFVDGMPFGASWYELAAAKSSATTAEDVIVDRLRDYVASSAAGLPSHMQGPMSRPGEATDPVLADVDTMTARLAARLEKEPDDVKGWRMLGWSYFHTDHFDESEKAYARAVALDPNDAELKAALEEAKAKLVSKGTAAALSKESAVAGADVDGKPTAGPSADDVARTRAMPENERDAMIRSMVERLDARLQSSPRDSDGWISLIRSRSVLGEKDAATAALRKALEIFKDEPDQLTAIAAVANELGVGEE